MKKRILKASCLLLALVLAAGLCACGKAPAAKAEPTAEAGTQTGSAAVSDTAVPEPETEPAPVTEPATEPAAPEITEGKHPREEGFTAAFDVYTLTDGTLTVSLQKQIYEEGRLRDCARAIRQDLETLQAYTGCEVPALEVYIVPNILDSNLRRIGSRLFCTAGELESGAYRIDLVRTVCGLGRTWQAVGLTGVLFDGETDDEALRAWYGDETHANQLSLAPVYFCGALADPETVRMAELTARSVTADFLDRAGWEAFRDLEHTPDAVSPWCESVLGREAPALPEGAETVDRLTVLSASNKLLTLKADEPMNRFRWALKTTDWLTGSEDAYDLLCSFYAGYWPMLARMEAGLPDAFAQVRENAEKEITIEFIPSNNLSSASWAQGIITLSYFNSCWHEVVHQLLPVRVWDDLEPRWEAEGLAEYYSLPIETECGWVMEGRIRYLTDDACYQEMFKDTDADDLTLRDLFLRNYTAVCPLPLEGEKLDQVRFSQAGALTTLLHPELQETKASKLTRSLANIAGFQAGAKDLDGNGLTYGEAELMMEYLMDRFGEDEVVSGYLDGQSPEEQFGVSYEELFADFLDWVRTQYDPA